MNATRAWCGSGLALWALAGLFGCVERKITIGSEPSGALVLLNDVEVGRTPVSVPFTWYGDYDVRIRLEKETGGGTENRKVERYYLHTHKKTETPWFEFIGVDLFAELMPMPFKDEQVWAFVVPPVEEPTNAQVIENARELRAELDKEQSRQKK